jgi:hypothetical protein
LQVSSSICDGVEKMKMQLCSVKIASQGFLVHRQMGTFKIANIRLKNNSEIKVFAHF